MNTKEYILKRQFKRYENTLDNFIKFEKEANLYSSDTFVMKSLVHDLATPLSSINAAFLIMEKQGIYGETPLVIDAAKSSVSSAIHILEDISQQKNSKRNKSTFKLDLLIQEVINTVQSPASKYHIRLTWNCNDELKVYTYRNLLERVLLNLVQNALEELAQDVKPKRLVNIDCINNNGYLTIVIEDNGRGIDRNNIRNIMLQGLSTKKGHKGLGLHFVNQSIKNEFHGSIEIKSEVGTGTRFFLNLSRICKK